MGMKDESEQSRKERKKAKKMKEKGGDDESKPEKKGKGKRKRSKESDEAPMKSRKEEEAAEAYESGDHADVDSTGQGGDNIGINAEQKEGVNVGDAPISAKTKEQLKRNGFHTLFPIQSQVLSIAVNGHDVVGRAKTGQGKTLAFVLPMAERVSGNMTANRKKPLGIVIAPTRELAKQVQEDVSMVGKVHGMRSVCLYGGAQYQPQEDALKRGVEIVVGTPGRVKDHLGEKRCTLSLSSVMCRVLDEADRMLDMGFQDDVEHILSHAGNLDVSPQTIMMSATFPRWVENIASRYLSKQRAKVDLIGENQEQSASAIKHLLVPCQWHELSSLVADIVRQHAQGGPSLIFCQTKQATSELAESLQQALEGGAKCLHGDVPQQARETTLSEFRKGKFCCLVATDVAARGLDVSGITLVVQCDPPRDPEGYIHRAGRTARASSSGTSVLLCTRRSMGQIPMIERKCNITFERATPPQQSDLAASAAPKAAEALKAVQNRASSLFIQQARSLLEKSGDAATLIAKSLACIAGYKSLSDRSLLSSHSGATTLSFRTSADIKSPGYVWNILKRHLDNDTVENVRRMSITADRNGAIFDVPSELVETFLAAVPEEGKDGKPASFSIQVASHVPELASKPSQNQSSTANGIADQNGVKRSFGKDHHSPQHRNQNQRQAQGKHHKF